MAEGEGKPIHVGIKYDVDGNAPEKLHGIAGAAHHAGGEVHELSERFGEFRRESGLTSAALLGVGFGLGAWVEKAKEANAEQGRAIKGLAALYATSLAWDKNTDATERYTRSLALARENFEGMEEIGRRFAIDENEIARIYKTLGIAATPLHLSQKELLDLTEKTAAASKVYQVEGTDAANKIATALLGGPIRRTDDFGRALFAAVGQLKKGGSGHKALEEFSKAMSGFSSQADLMSHGLGDNIQRIQNTVEDLIRDLTKPLFSEVAKSMGDLATYLHEAGETGAPRLVEVSQELVTAFKEVEKLTKLVLDHWQEIAIVWGGAKVMSFVGGLSQALGGAAGLAQLSRMAMASTGVLAGAAVAGVGVMAYDQTASGKARQGTVGQLARNVLPSLNPGFEDDLQMTVDTLKGWGILNKAGQVQDRDALVSALALNQKVMQQYGDQLGLARALTDPNIAGDPRGIANTVADAMTKGLAEMIAKHPEVLGGSRELAKEDNADKGRRFTGKPETNIEHLEVKMNFEDIDPMQVMTRFLDDLNQQVGRRTQSALTHHDL